MIAVSKHISNKYNKFILKCSIFVIKSYFMSRFSDFVTANETADVQKLILSRDRFRDCGFDFQKAVNTVIVRKKLRTKVPSWYGNPELVYPSALSGEQCSSEFTADFKAALCERIFREDNGMASTFRVADLTGGLGVDSWAFSKVASKVLYNEAVPALADAALHNFGLLGIGNASVSSERLVPAGAEGTSIKEILGDFSPDIIFLDPARRDGAGKKVFLMEDCSPDVLKLKDELFEAARYLLLKLSPMADISMVLDRLGAHCREIHALSYEGECRELLVMADREWQGECSVTASTEHGSLRFTMDELGNSRPVFLSSAAGLQKGAFLFEPGKSLMKTAAFNALCTRFPLKKLGVSTHYYIVDTEDASACMELEKYGKIFEIREILPLNNRTLKETGRKWPGADMTARNVPMTTETMLAKASSGKRCAGKSVPGYLPAHIFGLRCDFTDGKSENLLLVCFRQNSQNGQNVLEPSKQ